MVRPSGRQRTAKPLRSRPIWSISRMRFSSSMTRILAPAVGFFMCFPFPDDGTMCPWDNAVMGRAPPVVETSVWRGSIITMAPSSDRRSFRVRPALRHAVIAFGLAFVACTGPVRADDPQPLGFGHSLAHGQPVIVDVTDDIKADVHVTTWNRPSVDITVAPSGHYADAVRLSGGIENGSLA